MKKIGFLSFGHWSDSYGSAVRSAAFGGLGGGAALVLLEARSRGAGPAA